jgi:hypothetical protein
MKEFTAAAMRASFALEASQRDEQLVHMEQKILDEEGRLRTHNLQFLIALDHALHQATGSGLAKYLPKRRAVALGVGEKREVVVMRIPGEEKDRSRSIISRPDGSQFYEVGIQMKQGVRQSPTVHLATDMGPVGFPAQQFLFSHIGIRGSTTWDILHRLHNDVVNATSSCGMMGVRLEFHAVTKLRKGPWSPGGKNHFTLLESAREMFSMIDETSELFAVVYEEICYSRGSSGPEVGTHAHMKEIWMEAREHLLGAGEGLDSRLGRWWSFETLSRRAFSMRWFDILVLLWIGWQRNWWAKLGDCPLFRREAAGAVPPEGDGELAFAGEAAPEDGADAEGGEDEEHAVSAVSTTKAAREEIRKMRSKTGNLLRFACDRLLSPLHVRSWAILAFTCNPLQDFFLKMVHDLKSMQGTHDLRVNLYRSSMTQVCHKIIANFFSPEFSSRLGCSTRPFEQRTAMEKKQDGIVCSLAWAFCMSVASNVWVTSLSSQTPPECFVGAMQPSESEKEAWLQHMKLCWETLTILEEQALTSPQCADFVKSLVWPTYQWPRECMVRLFEHGFRVLPGDLEHELKEFAISSWSSLVCENTFNAVRNLASKNRGGKAEPATVWHCASFGSSVMKDHGRPSLEISQRARAIARGLPTTASFFEQKHYTCSIDQDALLALTRKATWPTQTPERWQIGALQWQSALLCKGDWKRLNRAWLSLLAVPGSVVMNAMEKRAYMVLYACQFGAVLARMPISATTYLLSLAPCDLSTFSLAVMDDTSIWRACEVEVLPPGACADAASPFHLVLKLTGAKNQLWHFAALRGFRGCTLTMLRRFYDELCIAAPKKPRTEERRISPD